MLQRLQLVYLEKCESRWTQEIFYISLVPDSENTVRLGFEVLTAVSMKIAVFWVVAPCSLVEVYQRYNPEDSNLHTVRLFNFFTWRELITF
jgi:hypothetical protein